MVASFAGPGCRDRRRPRPARDQPGGTGQLGVRDEAGDRPALRTLRSAPPLDRAGRRPRARARFSRAPRRAPAPSRHRRARRRARFRHAHDRGSGGRAPWRRPLGHRRSPRPPREPLRRSRRGPRPDRSPRLVGPLAERTHPRSDDARRAERRREGRRSGHRRGAGGPRLEVPADRCVPRRRPAGAEGRRGGRRAERCPGGRHGVGARHSEGAASPRTVHGRGRGRGTECRGGRGVDGGRGAACATVRPRGPPPPRRPAAPLRRAEGPRRGDIAHRGWNARRAAALRRDRIDGRGDGVGSLRAVAAHPASVAQGGVQGQRTVPAESGRARDRRGRGARERRDDPCHGYDRRAPRTRQPRPDGRRHGTRRLAPVPDRENRSPRGTLRDTRPRGAKRSGPRARRGRRTAGRPSPSA